MNTRSSSVHKLQSLLRQGVNWWLGYLLAQPVDIDISVLIRFISSYAGLPLVFMLSNKVRSIIPIPVRTNTPEKSVEMIISQESYSSRL